MATIITKNSSTASSVPAAGSLVQGELAVNVTDKKLYTKDSGGSVVKVVGSLGNQEANAVNITGGTVAGITDLAVADGGTGASDAATARTNLGAAASATTLTAGTGLSGGGDLSANRTFSIANTTVAAGTYGSATAVGSFTVNAQGQLTSASNTTISIPNTQVTGLGTLSTQNASSVAITGGSITGITDLAVADGGTGASDAAGARTNLGLGSLATQNASSVSITGGSITGITDLAVADGGTGASSASGARTNLGLVIGTDIPSPTGTGASGTWSISITGNAGTVTNGIYSTGSYADPAWITSLSGSKVTGNISGNAANVTGTVAVANGGTGSTATPTNGQLLIGNGTGFSLATITAGSNVTITNSAGGITIAATGGGSATPGGSDTQLQYNSSGTFAGASKITTDGTNLMLRDQADLRFADADSSNWVAFQAPATISTNITWTLPSADGTSGQVLQTDGSGTLSWASGGGGGISAGKSIAFAMVFGG